jgi:proline dehydrogenase
VNKNQETIWTLPDWQSTVNWCKNRNSQGIRCTIDVLGENSKTNEDVERFVREYKTVIRSIKEENLRASLSVKLTALGANFDKNLCRNYVQELYNEAKVFRVPFELDMEGTPLVDFTLDCALQLSSLEFHITLALQAYLNRTTADLYSLLDRGIRVRLVKGAYQGDVDLLSFIQERFKFLFIIAMDNPASFGVGTHDPELIEWIKKRTIDKKRQLELGFLKGFGDETKLELVEEGWRVMEYVPFGSESTAYETRRNRYIKELDVAGKNPVP